MKNFLSLKLEQTLMDSIAKINFKTPTPIQAQAIPVALEGKDVLERRKLEPEKQQHLEYHL